MALRPSGFGEYSPAEQREFDRLINCIQQNYQQFWYTHIYTPAVESNKVLLAKNGDETGKQIFGLYGLSQGPSDLKDYSLHFDLTVPFARYVLDRESELSFPFKRYQIQPVRRGERAQRGRLREFFQCDIDVIWRKDGKNPYLYYDSEILFTLGKTLLDIFEELHIQDTPVAHINNRKLIAGFLIPLVWEENLQAVTVLIDKYKKVEKSEILQSIQALGVSSDIAEKICTFVETKIDLSQIETLKTFSNNETFLQGVEELKEVLTVLEQFQTTFAKSFAFEIDFQIVRGLDYYTGTVFEFTLQNDSALWSICGGGRYEQLTGYIDPKRDFYAWVGGSIGLSRLLSKIFDEQSFSQQTTTEYLFLNFPETSSDIFSLAHQFQEEGKNVEIYPVADKLGKQFTYADKKGIPFVVILWEGEKSEGKYKIKNMKTWEETACSIA